jgi:uncharacterized iron-regulated membrane protein
VIYDSNGLTSYNTTTIYSNNNYTAPNTTTTNTTTNTTTKNTTTTNTTTTNTTTTNSTTNTTTNTTTNPTTPTVNANTTALSLDLQTAIKQASNGTGNYSLTNGGWYLMKKGYFSSSEYFFQYGGETTNLYNLDVTVTLKSFNTVMVSTTNTP